MKIIPASQFAVTPEQIAGYHRDGYLIVRKLFGADEVQDRKSTRLNSSH